MNRAVVYIHGKGGNAAEAEHYARLFPDFDVKGWDYAAATPWEAKEEFSRLFDASLLQYDSVWLIANSIGAYFSMSALSDKKIERAFFISPIVNMEKLITDMMLWAGVTEQTLFNKKEIPTDFCETLSWEYLSYVRSHPIQWQIPTAVLYGEKDNLTALDTVNEFVRRHKATLTVMQNGEHWFHTDEQMRFLDEWIRNATSAV